ncbi:MAG: hypothetical protein U9R24_05160 [Thermodesulfobacteriota bacterium]|nr:hypothetical protein [Thermodesulfobacteriota bacterium]
MEDATTRHINGYIQFAKQCISEGIQKDHIPLLWIAYNLEEIDESIWCL